MGSRRAGLSLLEVLLTIFIVAVGMLGVAALVPVGTYHATQATQAERSAACARAAFREIEARDMLRNTMWLWHTSTAPNGQYRDYPDADINELVPFVIDPLFVESNAAANGGNYDTQVYTAQDRSQTQIRLFPCASNYNNFAQLPRITLKRYYDASNPSRIIPMGRLMAEKIFRWHDDVSFTTAVGDDKGRPQLATSTNVIQSDGDYSWMVMVTPTGGENAPSRALPGGRLPAGLKRTYLVSVVVFYKRDLVFDRQRGPNTDPPVYEMQFAAPVLNNRVQVSGKGIKLRPGQWILLSSLLKPPQNEQTPLPIHRWYRVVATSQLDESSGGYEATIAGPPWPDIGKLVRPPQDRNQQLLTFTLCTVVPDVVGVYEKTIEVDTNTLMSQ